MHYTYIIRCKDNTIYTGITTDLDRILNEHITKDKKCAKYTLHHDAIRLETAFISVDRVSASKLEYHIKHLNKDKKEMIIQDESNLEKFLGNKIDISKYTNLRYKKL